MDIQVRKEESEKTTTKPFWRNGRLIRVPRTVEKNLKLVQEPFSTSKKGVSLSKKD